MLARTILVMLAMVASCMAKTWQVAVEDLTAQGVSATDASILSDRLRSELLGTGVFRVMERSQMDKVLKEQAFEASGACEGGQCAIQLGRLLSVDRLVVGSVGRIGSVYTMQIRLLDVETGEVVTTATEDRSGAIEGLLTKSIPMLAKRLASAQQVGREDNVVTPFPQPIPDPQKPALRKENHWFRWGSLAGAAGAGAAAVVFHLKAQDRKKAADAAVVEYGKATSGFETFKADHAQAVKDANSATTTAIVCDAAAGVLGAFTLTYAF
ncbi:MAG: hypothetical protein IPK50_15800 [Fibrobacterota bacterium]|nr:MAG: hypothetical protein IPK50_15800 [Fibrobacterota bacterium]